MRIDGSTLGLAACLLSIAAADDSNAAPSISIAFSTPPVFAIDQDKTISWSWADNTNGGVITGVNLYQNATSQLLANVTSSQAATPSTSSSTSTPTGGLGASSTTTPGGNELLQTTTGLQSHPVPRENAVVSQPPGAPDLLTWKDNEGNGTVTLLVNTSRAAWQDAGAFDQLLYMELAWSDADRSGSLYSYIMGFYDTEAMQALLIKNMTDNNDPPYENIPARPATVCASDGSDCTTPAATAPSSTSSTGTGALPPATTSTTSTTAKSSHNKLSSGAIAGIAVGCAVAGLLILAAIIYLVFRRRRSQAGRSTDIGLGSSYPSEGRRGIMADKEMHHIISDSPQSAYAQDEGVLHDRGAIAVAEHEREDYQPYSDRPRSGAHGGSADALGGEEPDSPGARSPTPPPAPVHSRYAHLVEEGMTEDEIRRLEEEERQLDEAIQQDEARHHHTS